MSYNDEQAKRKSDIYKSMRILAIWVICTLVFGLLQVWIVMLVYAMDPDNDFDGKKFALEGGLLFFSCAVTTSFLLDFIMSDNYRLSEVEERFFFIILPFAIITSTVAAFVYIHTNPPNKTDVEILKAVEYTVVTATIVYALGFKFKELRSKEKEKQKNSI